ncbi:MAG: hypothetical protein WBS19_12150 [Candidatus Korobacteraceae bacterium]
MAGLKQLGRSLQQQRHMHTQGGHHILLLDGTSFPAMQWEIRDAPP